MRQQKEARDQALGRAGAYREVTPERSHSKDPAPLKVKEVWVEDRRYVVCLNEEQKRKDALDRQAIVEHLRGQLKRGEKTLSITSAPRRSGGASFAVSSHYACARTWRTAWRPKARRWNGTTSYAI